MSDNSNLNILGISGSLRQGSYNSAALREAKSLAPAGMVLKIFDIANIPLYNEDIREKGLPDSVQILRDSIKKADGILIVTPEYNYSVPGVLKNAIDWASRPPEQPFEGKPIAIMGASMGVLGTSRAQYHLRQCFIYLNGVILNQPEVMIGEAHKKFDASGNLTDDKTRAYISNMLNAFAAWIKKVG